MPRELQRTIGLGGAIFTLVGYVVGSGIFILPGQLAATAGPGVLVAYSLAAVPTLFTCILSAQVGSAFPTSGATYVLTRRVLGPFWGFLLVWTVLVCAAIGTAFVAYGFADYLRYFLPEAPPMVTALIAIVIFVLVNLVGVQPAVWIQAILVVWFIAALLVFSIGGLLHADPANWHPFLPNGFGVAVGASIAAYFNFTGFAVIAEIAEEVKRPARTIPLTLLASFGIVLFIYLLVPLALTGVVPWSDLGALPAAVASAAERFLPRWAAAVISLSALAAAATSINGILLAQARDVFALARDHVFSERFGHLNGRTGVPDVAILLLGGLSCLAVLRGASITEYAVTSSLGVFLLQILASIAMLRLPAVAPEALETAEFRLSPFWRISSAVALLVTSVGFCGIGIVSSPQSGVLFGVVIGIGMLYYRRRRNTLASRGIFLDRVLHQ